MIDRLAIERLFTRLLLAGSLHRIESWRLLSVLCLIVAGISFVTAVILCVVFRIPSIIRLLTGRTARRAVEKNQNRSARRRREKVQKSLVHRIIKDIQKQSAQTETKDSVNLPTEIILDGGETEVLYAAYTQKLYIEEPMSESVKTIESEHLPEYFKLQVEDEIEFINSEERIAIRSEPISSMG